MMGKSQGHQALQPVDQKVSCEGSPSCLVVGPYESV